MSLEADDPLPATLEGATYAPGLEDISVLKGATASALYGYRGESGAIMVTTKKGSANKGIS